MNPDYNSQCMECSAKMVANANKTTCGEYLLELLENEKISEFDRNVNCFDSEAFQNLNSSVSSYEVSVVRRLEIIVLGLLLGRISPGKPWQILADCCL